MVRVPAGYLEENCGHACAVQILAGRSLVFVLRFQRCNSYVQICTAKARERDVCFSNLVREYMELPDCIGRVFVNYR